MQRSNIHSYVMSAENYYINVSMYIVANNLNGIEI